MTKSIFGLGIAAILAAASPAFAQAPIVIKFSHVVT
ncbi:MAG: C4-dicarboxylate ABC transporter, partial [Proteobacteria bacterium]|nr:C4-dicarboxylate ABC transporter [Pseudomonadota bacterium]